MRDYSVEKTTSTAWGRAETLALVWILAAMLLSVTVALLLHGVFPLFTLLWLAPPLYTLLRNKDAGRLGLRSISWATFVRISLLTLAGYGLLMALFEPWSHTYRMLVSAALSESSPDTTFGWLAWFPGPAGWAGMLFYSGLVTLFAEELFFHGWLLQSLLKVMRPARAVVLQAALQALPNLLAAFFLPPLQGWLYALVYAFLEIGIIGGWAAARTGSIWPSLVAATLTNFVLVLVLF